MRWKLPPLSLSGVAIGGFALGLFGTALWSSDDPVLRVPIFSDVRELTRLEPVRALPRTEMLLVVGEARRHLDAGRPWAAWRLLAEHLHNPEEALPDAVLVAARSAGAWGGWREARDLLSGRGWLAEVSAGEGLFLLARAEEELGDLASAAAMYRRYLALPEARERAWAQARLGRVLREMGEPRAAAEAFAEAAPLLPEISDWLSTLRVEQLAVAGDPRVPDLATQGVGGSSPVRLRRVKAEVRGWLTQGDTLRALRRLDWEARVLKAQKSWQESAQLQLDRARLLLQTKRSREAREQLRALAWESSIPAHLRQEAARLLGGVEGRTPSEELARAAAFQAASEPGLAAKALRAALAAGLPDDGVVRLRLARLLYEERDYPAARAAYLQAAERLRDSELLAEAELFAARSLYRAGSPKNALTEIRRVVERYPETAAAGTALFLLGDEAATLREGIAYYRRAAEITKAPEAREALYRVGDRSLRLDDRAGAVWAWEEYVSRYPQGEETARVAYQVARLHERAGRETLARAMYTAATLADPVSYYALRAGDRLRIRPLEQILSVPRPWVGLAVDQQDATRVLGRLQLLQELGLQAEWKAEFDAAVRNFEDRPAALLALAEGLRDQGHPVESIRLGRRLLARRNGEWDERLLRVVFPFPLRSLIEAAAEREGLDPMLLAALIRQESTFRPSVRSWVGATGLTQIMPSTGRWLAPSVGLHSFEVGLLEVPEVNLRMGAKYLSDLLKRYDGARDLALAGYNAGPGRADRWRRTLDYGRDTDAFREAIPFDETRHYVKVVLRNAAIYELLYGDGRGSGVRAGE